MRQKRAKAYRRLMQTYSLSFGFRQPYQVLGQSPLFPLFMADFFSVDSEMCKDAVMHKIDLEKQMHNVVQGDVKLSASYLFNQYHS